MNLIEERLFFNSVYRTDLELDLSNIKSLTKKLEYSPRPKGRGRQTRNFFPIEHPELYWVFQQTTKIIDAIADSWGIQRKLKLLNYWFNLDKKFDYSISHFHPEGIISGVFYIIVPNNSSKIVFERMDLQEHYFEGDVVNEYNYKNYSYEAVENRIILFPSYLKHRVEQNLTEDIEDSRISLSFNYA